MVFTDFDRQTATTICTLAKLVGNIEQNENGLVAVAQNLGIPKEEALIILSECDDFDMLSLKDERQKKEFVKNCFSYLQDKGNPEAQEVKLYKKVAENLGINPGSYN